MNPTKPGIAGGVDDAMVERASLAYEVEMEGNVYGPESPRSAMRAALESAFHGSGPATEGCQHDWATSGGGFGQPRRDLNCTKCGKSRGPATGGDRFDDLRKSQDSATGGECTCPKGAAPKFDLIDKACPQHAATVGVNVCVPRQYVGEHNRRLLDPAGAQFEDALRLAEFDAYGRPVNAYAAALSEPQA